ncbi:DUF2975 domain-containing protein [Pedobacter psychrodurus]|uniref:DUF2975 domain-containing protein n=1 Tax=Pedobacter psychrodurus TaxID=2530456 RepID=A0A4R0Q0V4_9SPHI|nr:DUF2975 domain-containing protein [Pedobacter psychrodurus]TCD26257.1 DUF2975 domain-containing protein [Pedobacter psychrodurus]
MEIKITTNQILKVLQILSWIIFIGLCVEAGGILVNTIITSFINPNDVRNFWDGADYLSSVYKFDQGYFLVITVVMIIVAVLKAIMFYLILKLFIEKKLSISQPFSIELKRFILKQVFLALGIGFFAHLGGKYTMWLTAQGVATADIQSLNMDGADVWFFMAVVLFIIVQVVNRGIEIQQENDLTI